MAHFVRGNTKEISDSLSKPATYKVLYWPIGANGATTRDLLELGGVQWEDLSPSFTGWQEEKLETPFHVLPVLYIKTEDGKDLVLSEAMVVEQFLAKKFNLLGDNDYEEQLIKAFHSSSAHLQSNFAQSVTWCPPDAKEENLAKFLTGTLKTFIDTHEKHLADNGDNGHYVGNRLSLADIRTANLIEHISVQPQGPQVLEIINKSAALTKLRETVAKDGKVAKWRSSPEYIKLNESSKAFFADPMKFIGPPSEEKEA